MWIKGRTIAKSAPESFHTQTVSKRGLLCILKSIHLGHEGTRSVRGSIQIYFKAHEGPSRDKLHIYEHRALVYLIGVVSQKPPRSPSPYKHNYFPPQAINVTQKVTGPTSQMSEPECLGGGPPNRPVQAPDYWVKQRLSSGPFISTRPCLIQGA